MTVVTVRAGKTITISDFKGAVPAGKTFAGWNTREDGTGAVFMPGKTVQIVESLTLYPMWRDAEGKE